MSRSGIALLSVLILLGAGLAGAAPPVPRTLASVPAAAADPWAAARQALATHASLVGDDPVAQARIHQALAALDLASTPGALDAMANLAPDNARLQAAAKLAEKARASGVELTDGAALARAFADAFGDGSAATKANLAALDTIAAQHGARLGPARALAIAAQQEADVGIGDANSAKQLLSLVDSEPAANAAPEVHARYALELAKARAGSAADDGRWERARDVLDAGVALRDAKARGASLVEQLDLALAVQAAPAPLHALPALPHYDSFSAALDGLYAAYGQSVPADQRAAAIQIDAAAPTTAAALARIIAAHVLAQEVAASGLMAGDAGVMALVSEDVAHEIAVAAPAVACIGFPVPPSSILVVDVVCQDNAYPAKTQLTIDAGGNDLYTNEAGTARGNTAVTVVDLAGDDVYEGISASAFGGGIGVLADLAGMDLYHGPAGQPPDPELGYVWGEGTGNGYADEGVALLVDVEGDDQYIGGNGYALTDGGQPQTFSSRGLLVDLAGQDAYYGRNAQYFEQGPAVQPTGDVGMIVDAGVGNDVYWGGNAATRYTFLTGGGEAILLDGGGDDEYLVTTSDWQVGNGVAVNGGRAMLVDLGGSDKYDDLYHARGVGNPTYLRNGVGVLAAGFILDLTGDDVFHGDNGIATDSRTAGALDCRTNPVNIVTPIPQPDRSSTGLIFNGVGNDSYVVESSLSGLGNGAARADPACRDVASALLYDGGGDDVYAFGSQWYYAAPMFAVNGAGISGGRGALVDAGQGNDVYDADLPTTGIANGAGYDSAGVLYDGGGADAATLRGAAFAGNGAARASDINQVAAAAYFDEGGNDQLNAEIANGAANGGARLGSALLYHGPGGALSSFANFTNGDGAANGGAGTGSALLATLADSNWFETHGSGTLAATGGAQAGTAFLLSGTGSDCYVADATGFLAANGGGAAGAGFLWDPAGDDCYQASSDRVTAADGGGYLGAGMLVDLAGNDLYNASAGTFGGLNGGGDAGVGMLLDQAGDDTYDALLSGAGGANGGATTGGVGLLLDGAGTNGFTANALKAAAVNGAAAGWPFLDGAVLTGGSEVNTTVPLPGGVGILLGGSGDDSYVSNGVTQGAGDLYGVGVLLDSGGANTYTALPGALAQGAGRLGGFGLLLDRGTGSVFSLLDAATGQGAGLQGVGLLLQATPDALTTYSAAPTASPAVEAGGGIGMRVASGLSTVLGLAPSVECRNSSEIQRVSLPGQIEIRVCAVDTTTSERLRNPATGSELDDITKPVVPCTGPCYDAVTAALGPDAPGWLEASSMTPSTSGGLLSVSDANVLLSRYTMQSADDVCRMTCFMVSQLAM